MITSRRLAAIWLMPVERAGIGDFVRTKTLSGSGTGRVQMGSPKKRTERSTEITFILDCMCLSGRLATSYLWI